LFKSLCYSVNWVFEVERCLFVVELI